MESERTQKMRITPWLKKESLRLLIIALPFVFLLLFWQDLPSRIAMHWNLNGQPDGYTDKFGLLGLAAINLVLLGLFFLLPHLNPRHNNDALYLSKWHLIEVITHLFVTYIFFIVALMALNYQLQIDLTIKYGLIGLFLLLGNYLGTVKRNYFIGIRTPWTLNSDYVWQKTHRFTATVWVWSSLLMLLYNFWHNYPWAFYAYIGLLVIAPLVYSYIVYKNQPPLPE